MLPNQRHHPSGLKATAHSWYPPSNWRKLASGGRQCAVLHCESFQCALSSTLRGTWLSIGNLFELLLIAAAFVVPSHNFVTCHTLEVPFPGLKPAATSANKFHRTVLSIGQTMASTWWSLFLGSAASEACWVMLITCSHPCLSHSSTSSEPNAACKRRIGSFRCGPREEPNVSSILASNLKELSKLALFLRMTLVMLLIFLPFPVGGRVTIIGL